MFSHGVSRLVACAPHTSTGEAAVIVGGGLALEVVVRPGEGVGVSGLVDCAPHTSIGEAAVGVGGGLALEACPARWGRRGFEARRLRSSHLNRRGGGLALEAVVRPGEGFGVSGFRGSSLALLAPQPARLRACPGGGCAAGWGCRGFEARRLRSSHLNRRGCGLAVEVVVQAGEGFEACRLRFSRLNRRGCGSCRGRACPGGGCPAR